MNFLFGGAERDPIKEKSYKVEDLVRFHGLKDSWTVLERFNTKSRESWIRINNFQDTIKNRGLNSLDELVARLQSPYSGRSPTRPISEAIKIYKDKQYAKNKYGLMGTSFDHLLDLEKIKEDLVKADNNNEEVLEELAEAESEEREVIPSIKNKILYGEEWIREVDEKITDKMNSFTSKLFGLDIWDFNETIEAFREAGELGSMTSQSDLSLTSSSRGSRRSSRRSRGRPRSRSGSQGSRRSRSRSRSRGRPRSRSGSQGSRRSRSRSRPRSRSGSQGSRRSRSRSRPRSRSGSQGSRPRSRSRTRSRSRSSHGVSDLERRVAQLQQTPPQQNSNSSERRRRIDRENESFRELERRFTELQQRPVSRRLFD